MRRIVLSADDFGRSHDRNLAIDYAFKNDLIKSAALLVNTDFTEEAVILAKEGGYIQHLHCHLNVSSGPFATGGAKPVLPETRQCSAWCNKDGDFEQKPFRSFNLEGLRSIRILFKELEAQYLLFKDITNNKGNCQHIDFHFFENTIRWPVALAYGRLLRKYGIQSARITGMHHHKVNKTLRKNLKFKLCRLLSYCPKTKVLQSSPIDYYLFEQNSFKDAFELYVHPNYVDNRLMDDSFPIFGKDKELLSVNIQKVTDLYPSYFISWADVN